MLTLTPEENAACILPPVACAQRPNLLLLISRYIPTNKSPVHHSMTGIPKKVAPDPMDPKTRTSVGDVKEIVRASLILYASPENTNATAIVPKKDGTFNFTTKIALMIPQSAPTKRVINTLSPKLS